MDTITAVILLEISVEFVNGKNRAKGEEMGRVFGKMEKSP